MSSGGKHRVRKDGRTDGRMKPHGSRGKKGIGSQFIAHTREMRLSIAWKMLTGNDKLALERLEEEHMAHGGTENGRLRVTYNDFAEAGIRRNSISTTIARVEALGFVECTDRGRASKAEFRFPAAYRLTYVQGNLPATNDWKSVVNAENAEQRIGNAMLELSERTSILRKKLQVVAAKPPAERRAA